jgi:redox-sensitive bicupin YhaK (pirin superfamily)
MSIPGIDLVIVPPLRDLGDGFHVKRVLPSPSKMMVGPFIFFDQMGPTHFNAGQGLDVRPHPHIGLATVTYLFEGEILHRDSVGSVQAIRPGEVNWMTAGRGIAHSERTSPAVRASGGPISGIQLWVALPKAHEETNPSFAHFESSQLPRDLSLGASMTVIAGEWRGVQSPVEVYSPLFYVDARLQDATKLSVPATYAERAIYVTEGALELGGHRIEAGQMLVLHTGQEVVFNAVSDSRAVVLGGEPFDEPRFIWWNLVASSAERIHAAREDWQAGRFQVVPGESESIPAPELGAARPRSSESTRTS